MAGKTVNPEVIKTIATHFEWVATTNFAGFIDFSRATLIMIVFFYIGM